MFTVTDVENNQTSTQQSHTRYITPNGARWARKIRWLWVAAQSSGWALSHLHILQYTSTLLLKYNIIFHHSKFTKKDPTRRVLNKGLGVCGVLWSSIVSVEDIIMERRRAQLGNGTLRRVVRAVCCVSLNMQPGKSGNLDPQRSRSTAALTVTPLIS